MTKSAILLLTLSALVACEAVDSVDVMTDGVYADITAEAEGDGTTRTSAILRVGGATSNTFMELVETDTLTASTGDETQTMIDTSIGDFHAYVADFDVEAEDTEFVVAFEREVDESAPNTTMSLPALFDVTGPEEAVTFSRSEEDITLTWEPSGSEDEMYWSVTGDCFYDAEGEIDGDPGTVVVEAGALESVDEDEPTTCEATLTLTRSRLGDLDPNYGEGGAVFGRQIRSVDVLVSP
jgi:hypothetical protein